jgi:hypothetical protein
MALDENKVKLTEAAARLFEYLRSLGKGIVVVNKGVSCGASQLPRHCPDMAKATRGTTLGTKETWSTKDERRQRIGGEEEVTTRREVPRGGGHGTIHRCKPVCQSPMSSFVSFDCSTQFRQVLTRSLPVGYSLEALISANLTSKILTSAILTTYRPPPCG